MEISGIAQENTRVRVPRLLYEDHSRHVLVIKDLGDNLVLLDEWLVLSSQSRRPPSPSLCQSVGERLGHFLTCIHGLQVSDNVLKSFENLDVEVIIGNEVVAKIGEYLGQYLNKGDAQTLSAAINDDFKSSAGRPRGVFSIGDLWTGSILVSEQGQRIRLIDFEFAGDSGRALQGMAQLGTILVPSAHRIAYKPDDMII